MRRMLPYVLTFALTLLLSCVAVEAQAPQPVASTVVAGVTIGTTNVFQQALPSVRRFSCLIQYNGANTGYVFFGPTASASLVTSIQLKAQQAVSCATVNGLVLTDAVQVTATLGDTFVVYQQ